MWTTLATGAGLTATLAVSTGLALWLTRWCISGLMLAMAPAVARSGLAQRFNRRPGSPRRGTQPSVA